MRIAALTTVSTLSQRMRRGRALCSVFMAVTYCEIQGQFKAMGGFRLP
jgi:hypothetical protein